MQLPIGAPAPLVTAHAEVFRDLFENRRQLHHFQNDLTGLIVLDNKSLANITRCVLESADKTTLSRFFSTVPWFQERVNDGRLTSLLQQTQAVRGPQADAALLLDDTLGEPVGSLCEDVDRHDNHGEDTSPLAHHPVTSHALRGPVRFPVDWRVSRRYEACTRWETCVHPHVPARVMPTTSKARTRLQKAVAPLWVEAPDLPAFHAQCRTTIALGLDLLEAARRHTVPLRVLVCDRWSRAEEVVAMARSRNKDWLSGRKKNRTLETHSFVLHDAVGKRLLVAGPHLAVEDLVPLIPPPASRAVPVRETTSWTLTLAGRIAGRGQVRLVGRGERAELTGTSAGLVTNWGDWHAPRRITLSLQRWPRETLSQDGKTSLGVDAYRMRTAEAIGQHWCLVFVA